MTLWLEIFKNVFFIFFLQRSRPSERPRFSWRRERSMEDLHKDIETIWRELQEIDKLTQSSAGDGENR